MHDVALPDSSHLAHLVSAATEPMFGLSFSLSEEQADVTNTDWRTFGVPIKTEEPLMVVIAADPVGSRELAAAVFSCEPTAVESSMIDDALGELVNIVAGQVKVSMGLKSTLGLPALLSTPPHTMRSAHLRTGGKEFIVWVAVGASPQ